MTAKGIRQTAFETRQLIERLSKLSVGQEISYREIMKACELPSLSACRSYLSTARNALRRDGILFEAIRGKGLRRMSDEEIATNCPEWRRRRIRCQSRNLAKDIGAIKDFDALSDEAKISVYVAQTQSALIEKATGRKINNRLSDAARAKNDEILVGESLRLMMEN